jgi:hypothetical protein
MNDVDPGARRVATTANEPGSKKSLSTARECPADAWLTGRVKLPMDFPKKWEGRACSSARFP